MVMSDVLLFLLGTGIGFGLGMFAGCMLSFSQTQESEREGDDHGCF